TSLVFVALLCLTPFAAAQQERPATLTLKKHEIKDPGMGDIVSHTMLLPADWQVQGGVNWRPGMKPFVGVALALNAPDGSGVSFMPAINCTFAQVPPHIAQHMQQPM